MKRSNKGFTFIELLVTVTIIIIISVGGMVIFSGSSKKARDSRRLADLEKIRTALELYRQENARYPTNPNQPYANSPPGEGLEQKYIDNWPIDPSTSGDYGYIRDTMYTYRIAACFEIDAPSGSTWSAGPLVAPGTLIPTTCAAATIGGTNAVVLANP